MGRWVQESDGLRSWVAALERAMIAGRHMAQRETLIRIASFCYLFI